MDNTLQVHAAAVRKALGPYRGLLKTKSGRGYRLLGRWIAQSKDARVDPVDRTRVQARVEPEPAHVEPVQSNLPATASDLIGQAAAVRQLLDLTSAYRVVTLTGPGGIGKTRLALEVSRILLPEFKGDVSFAELTSVTDDSLVATAVASVLGLHLGGADISPESLARAVGGRRLLLVIDNCEHVIDAVANLVEMLLRLCPATSVLATSRELMRIEGEHAYRVPPLDVPAEDLSELAQNQLLESSAVQLFIARAAAQQVELRRQGELSSVAAICRRLDGIPLAIEFAAARAVTLGVEHVLSRLDDRFALLTSGRRTALPKHRTLRATLDWSYELLSDPERLLLRRLAIFTGAFSLEAANAVTASSELPPSEVTDVIVNLVAKSLLTRNNAGIAAQFRLLETTRAYALEKFVESGEVQQFARQHAEYYRDLFKKLEYGRGATPATIADLGNARAALEWCFEVNGNIAIGIELASVAAPGFLAMSLLSECHYWTGRAIRALDDARQGGPEEMHLQACFGLSSMHMFGQGDVARSALDRSLAIAEEHGDVLNQFGLLGMLHMFHVRGGDFNIALEFARRRRTLARAIEDPATIALSQSILGRSLHMMGDLRGARAELEASLQNWSRPHRTNSIYLAYDRNFRPGSALARTLWLLGYPAQAVERAQEAIAIAQRLDRPQSLVIVLLWAASVFLWTGDLENAELHTNSSISYAETLSLGALLAVGQCRKAELVIHRGHAKEGVVSLRAALEKIRAMRFGVLRTEFNISLVQGLAAIGQCAEGLASIDETIREVETHGEAVYMPELLRVRGGPLLSMPQPRSDEAELCLTRSLELSRAQGARAWELRTATDLAALYVARGRPERARALLQPAFDQFAEGRETADLRAAERLLTALS